MAQGWSLGACLEHSETLDIGPPAHDLDADTLVGLAVLAALVVVLGGLRGAAQLAAAVQGRPSRLPTPSPSLPAW